MNNRLMRAVFLHSNVLSNVAWNAVKRTGHDGDQALIAILFGCACVESVLNEILYDLRVTATGRLPQGYAEAFTLAREAGLYDDRAPLEKKLRVVGLARTGSALDLGAAPYQEFLLLVQLRNWIVHLRPEEAVVKYCESGRRTHLAAEAPRALAQELRRRRVIDATEGPAGASLVLALRTESAAQWSYCVTHAVVSAMASWFPEWRDRLGLGHPSPKPGWSLAHRRLQPTARTKKRRC